MRLIVDIEDADRSFVTGSKEHHGKVVLSSGPGVAIRGSIVGMVEPHAAVGNGGRGTVIYDLTLLEAM